MMEMNLLKKFIEVGINKGKEQYTILINCVVKYVMTVNLSKDASIKGQIDKLEEIIRIKEGVAR